MREQAESRRPKLRWLTSLAAGLLLLLFILLGTFIVFMLKRYRLLVADQLGTPTVSMVSTPRILVHVPTDASLVRYEDFSSDLQDWSLQYLGGKVEIVDGKLVLQSYKSAFPLTVKNQNFIPTGDTYYVQADLTTDVSAASPYGLVFGLNDSTDTYYVFDILPRSKQFRLIKAAPQNWAMLLPATRGQMKPYPEVNTLSVYFNKGLIDLYINGNSIAEYADSSPYHFAGVGVLESDPSYRLIVDNFFAYSQK